MHLIGAILSVTPMVLDSTDNYSITIVQCIYDYLFYREPWIKNESRLFDDNLYN